MSEVYKLKPAEWRKIENGDPGEWWTWSTVFGSIDVEQRPGEGSRWRYCFDEYYDEGNHDCDSVEAGKAEAEAFYRSRIMPALVTEGT